MDLVVDDVEVDAEGVVDKKQLHNYIIFYSFNSTIMAKKQTTNRENIQTSIVLGALFISAALIFVGLKANKWWTLDTSELDAKIANIENSLEDKIDEGIERYIKKQEEEFKRQQQAQVAEQVQVVGDISIDDDAILWDPDAPVTIVEFSDYECPFCKRYYTQTYPEIKKNYVDKWLVKIVFRDYPLNFHDPVATKEALAAECARKQGDDETYYAFHDFIFDNTSSNGRGFDDSKLWDFAKQLDLDDEALKDCISAETYKSEVQNDFAEWQKYGVSWTPAFFVNGRSLKWAQPYSAFETIIQDELKKVGK